MSYTEFHKGKFKIVARGDEAIKKYIKDNNLEERLDLDIEEETGKLNILKIMNLSMEINMIMNITC